MRYWWGAWLFGVGVLKKVLLSKWLCRFSVEQDSFWRKVIMGKYEELQGLVLSRRERDLCFMFLESNKEGQS